MQSINSVSLIVAIVVAAVYFSSSQTNAAAIVDSLTAKQCRQLCQTSAPSAAARARRAAQVEGEVMAVPTELKPKAKSFSGCMDKCLCSAFCVLFEADTEFPYDGCYPKCVAAKPNTSPSYQDFVEKFLA